MTRKDQIMISNEMFDVHTAMDTAAELLQTVVDKYCLPVQPHQEHTCKEMRAEIIAAAEFLYKACLQMDFITGEETPLTEAYKRNSAQFIEYHNIAKRGAI